MPRGPEGRISIKSRKESISPHIKIMELIKGICQCSCIGKRMTNRISNQSKTSGLEAN